MKNKLVFLFIILTLLACATVGSMKDRKGSGISKSYDFSYEKVFNAALEASKLQNLELQEGGRTEHYIVFKKSGSAFSYGELVAIFFDESQGNKTAVEIVSKKRIATNLFAKDWTSSFFKAMDMELEKK
ncbi:MAG: hypothetical protein M1308_13795 [Actinobacteria bacterium]|nr:hypothetical protein [Actinomycetota bacterium]